MECLERENKNNLIDYFIVFFIFDLLFMPNFFASTPISFYLMIFLSPFLFSLKKNYFFAYLLLVAFMLASVINGLSINTLGAADNLKRLVQMSLLLSMFFLDFKRVHFNYLDKMLRKIICVFVIYLVFLLSLSLFMPDFYLQLLSKLSPNASEMISANVEMFRFSYIFSDPNTLGYLLVFLTTYYLFYASRNVVSFCTYIGLFFLVISTQSRGALLAFFAVTSIILISRSRFSFSTFKIFIFIIFTAILVYFAFQDYFKFIFEAFEKRSEIEEAMGTGIGGGRDKKYIYLLQNFNFNFYGVGYSLFIDGLEFRPHSDLIRMILSYGVSFLFVFICLFISKNFKNFVLFFAFLFPFLLNSAVDDFRLFGIFILIFLFMKHSRAGLVSNKRLA